ncbi:aldose 1-epimerase family protein [Microvirga massiliensis]|uniref:aldose 1-epimerase family protein n=1 Tax=Microvirga massiliensis TaxID=1033741 RepID=UPI00062B7B56|nr:aldose 1-epimerase family protein [Microvirga massiliensis]
MAVTIESEALHAEISPRGAELTALRRIGTGDLLWNGDPAFWTGRSPLLFPIVGRVRGNYIQVDDRHYPLPQHGFARTRTFTLIETARDRCRWSLPWDDDTLAQFPFPFRLEVSYHISGTTLAIAADVLNEGDGILPVSFGYHPAFRWPLPCATGRAEHTITFSTSEPAGIRRPVDGLLSANRYESPLEGQSLVLRDGLFEAGALIWDELASRSVVYTAPGAPKIIVEFDGLPQLGIWTKPGAGFVCIEPWHGYADPEGFSGEFRDKPGLAILGTHEQRRFAMTIRVD